MFLSYYLISDFLLEERFPLWGSQDLFTICWSEVSFHLIKEEKQLKNMNLKDSNNM